MAISEKLALLSEVVGKHRPDLLPRVATIQDRPLSVREQEHLRHAIAEEIVASGFDESHKHNARGRRLEDLIDWIGRL